MDLVIYSYSKKLYCKNLKYIREIKMWGSCMKKIKLRKVMEVMGIALTIFSIVFIFNADKFRMALYEKDRYIPMHNIFYEDRQVSLSNTGKLIASYDGVSIIISNLESGEQIYTATLDSRGDFKDFKWSDDDNYLVYLKDNFDGLYDIWVIDLKSSSNHKLCDLNGYSDLSWVNTASIENFSFPVYEISDLYPTYYSTSLNYNKTQIINDEKKYTSMGFNSSGEPLVGISSDKMNLRYVDPHNGSIIGSINIADSPSAGYFEVIDDMAYMVFGIDDKINLVRYDGTNVEIIKENISPTVKIEDIMVLDGEYVGFYGIDGSVVWNIEKKFEDSFSRITQDGTGSYILLDKSKDLSKLLVRKYKEFDPGQIYMLDRSVNDMKQVSNIKYDLALDRLYKSENIQIKGEEGELVSAKFTPSNKKYSNGDLFVFLDSDITNSSMDDFYDQRSQVVADRGISVLQIRVNYKQNKDDVLDFQDVSKKIASEIEDFSSYLKTDKKEKIKRVHIVATGKSSIFAANIAKEGYTAISGVILLEPILDIENAPSVSVSEYAFINNIENVPSVDEFINDYKVSNIPYAIYLNIGVTDSDTTQQFYKTVRGSTDKFLYKKARNWNEMYIGSTYLIEDYVERFMR